MKFKNEAELVSACLDPAHSEAAFRQLYISYAPAIYRKLWWYGASGVEAEELVTDTVLAFHAALLTGKYKPVNKLRAFLSTIAYNKWCSACRKKKKTRKKLREYFQKRPPEKHLDDPLVDDLLQEQIKLEALSACVAKLNPTYQQIVKLRCAGMNRVQIAEATHCTADTIRTRFQRIRKQVQTCLDKKTTD